MTDDAYQRLDKFLWCARFAATRSACAAMAETGLVRINRQPTDKPHAKIRVGDVLTLPLYAGVRVIEVLGLGERRGPATEARALYRIVEGGPRACGMAGPGGDASPPHGA
jgi:ribosome-associated heat shock protein Hsp15